MYRTIFARVGNRADAEDLTAEVFPAALRPLDHRALGEVRGLLGYRRTVLAAHWRETLGREITSIDDIEQPPESEQAISDAPQRVAGVLDTCRIIIARSWNYVSCKAIRSRSRLRKSVSVSRTQRCFSIAHYAWPHRSTKRKRIMNARGFAATSTTCSRPPPKAVPAG